MNSTEDSLDKNEIEVLASDFIFIYGFDAALEAYRTGSMELALFAEIVQQGFLQNRFFDLNLEEIKAVGTVLDEAFKDCWIDDHDEITVKINRADLERHDHLSLSIRAVAMRLWAEGIPFDADLFKADYRGFDLIVVAYEKLLFVGRTEGESAYYELDLPLAGFEQLYYFDIFLKGGELTDEIPLVVFEKAQKHYPTTSLDDFAQTVGAAIASPLIKCFEYSGIAITVQLV